MQLTDINLLSGLQKWLAEGEEFWLCTVLATYGSAPRPQGSLFAWNGKTRLGSISGGCLEDAFIEKLNRNEISDLPAVFRYGKELIADDIQVELPCGGTIQLLVEKISDKSEHFTKMFELAEQHQSFVRYVDLQSGERSYLPQDHSISTAIKLDDRGVTIRYDQVWSILILGISQVSEWVAKMALMAGYSVEICDMRESLAASWTFDKQAGGVDVTWISPDLFIDKFAHRQSAIVALAHDPRIDDLGLMAAVEGDAYYIGAMGSLKTSEKRFERLERIGDFTPQQLDRLHAPIGLPIGSKTPFEIAIAILADIISKRNQIELVKAN
ncbi:XdhC family protein [Vibrio sp. SS-MA-C1-2]|uniref:XdhC family protein n=1 Tax=Vibrio sp. SS-MA-C1-2 TaxID=2908646 RepID=UPI001F18CAAB|nr:XdhC family protein [Vibrio sp. SS-MA-C1-2]UJF16846.1 XdhC family protein [Vibrio sp. SS-MA-C1-2]